MSIDLDRYGSEFTGDVAYRIDFSRHRKILPLQNGIPEVNNAWVAPNATLAGQVTLSKYSTVWYGAVLRGDVNPIRVGYFSSIGDKTVIRTDHSLPQGLAASVNIGKNVTIGANCVIHSSIIDDDCVIGDNVIIQQGARLERGCQVLSNTVVVSGSLIPSGTVFGGSPAKFVRNLSEKE